MKRILLPNLFFEEELQSISTTGSAKAQRLVADLGPVMGLLGIDDGFPADKVDTGTAASTGNNRTIVLVEDTARPELLPPALQHIEFLTLQECAGVLRNEPRVRTDPADLWHASPWGWSDVAISTLSHMHDRKIENDEQTLTAIAAEMRATPINAPDINAVGFINSRQFQSQFDVAIEMDGYGRIDAFGTLCRSAAEVQTAIEVARRYSTRGWVIKADLSHASRNRLLGTAAELRPEQLAWLKSRFDHNECVYIEPWIERIMECGLQFFITQSESTAGRVNFIGAAEMLTDDTGQYRGSVVHSAARNGTPEDAPQLMIWRSAIDHCRRIAEVVAASGYFGNIGQIDGQMTVFHAPLFQIRQNNLKLMEFTREIIPA